MPLYNPATAGAATIATQDEGTQLTASTSSVNYVGAGVTATNSGTAVTVTIPGGGSSKFSQNYSAVTIYSNTGATTVTNGIATQPVSNGATAYITSHLPNTYAGGGITVDIYWAVDTDTDSARTIVWATSIMRVQTGTDDMNTESYATASNTASVTSGAVRRWQKSTVSFANGTAMDSAVANETIRVKMVLSFTGGGSVLISNIVVRET